MNPDAIEALAVFGGGAMIAWAAAFAWGKWLKHRYDELRIERSATTDADRLARMESAIEALGVELERIGEAQRYALKLLDQQPSRTLVPGQSDNTEPRVITPH